jgi:hypothetical protein
MKRYESPAAKGWLDDAVRQNRGRPRSATVEGKLRRQICKTGRRMYGSGLVVATEGNLSVRVDRDRILVTPGDMQRKPYPPRPASN